MSLGNEIIPESRMSGEMNLKILNCSELHILKSNYKRNCGTEISQTNANNNLKYILKQF
jgi:hypothetical protein